MMNWFMAGGSGMFLILAIGIGSIGSAVKAVREPTAPRLAALRSLPTVIVTSALFSFGTGLWAVHHVLESDTFMAGHGLTRADLPATGLIGFAEAAQTLTLGALLAVIVLALRIVADARYAAARGEGAAAKAA
jgi:hypothetical protein